MTPSGSPINFIYIKITLAVLSFNFWPMANGLDFIH